MATPREHADSIIATAARIRNEIEKGDFTADQEKELTTYLRYADEYLDTAQDVATEWEGD